jgi:hypothetical protein
MYTDQWKWGEGKSLKSKFLIAGLLFKKVERRIVELESIVAILEKEKVDRELVDSIDERMYSLEEEVKEVEDGA